MTKRAVMVTGSSKGIGRAVAEGFARSGYTVILVARGSTTLEQAVRQIRGNGGDALGIPADVTKDDEVRRLFNKAWSIDGLDVLVNNVGLLQTTTRLSNISLKEWQSSLNANLTSVFLCSHYFADMLIRSRQPGVIINTSSRAAEDVRGGSPYGIAKCAVEALTRQMAADLYDDHISVNAVVPPFTDTSGTRSLGLDPELFSNAFQPEAFVGLYLFLASEQGRQISGRIIDAEAWLQDPYLALYCRKQTWRLKKPLNDADRVAMGNMGVNPLGASSSVINTLRETLGAFGASCLTPYPELRPSALLGLIAKQHEVATDNIVLGNGFIELIRLVLSTFGDTNGEVIYAHPGFSQIRELCILEGLYPVEVPLVWDESTDSWGQPDLRSMLEKVCERTRVIYLINPQIPTGRVISRSRFEDFIRYVPPRTIILVDETYYDYLDESCIDTFNTAQYIRNFENIIALRSFSKGYGLAGVRIGYALAPSKIVQAMSRRQIPFSITTVSQIAAQLALEDKEHIDQTRRFVTEKRRWLSEALAPLGITMMPSYTNLLMFKYPGEDLTRLISFLSAQGISVKVSKYMSNTFCYSLGDDEENAAIVQCIREYMQEKVQADNSSS